MSQVVYVGSMMDGLTLSDRLAALLGPDLVLVIGRALSASDGGLLGGLDRLRRAVAEAQEAAQVDAIDAADAASEGGLGFDELAKILTESTTVDPAEIIAEMTRRVFAPEMTRWKQDLLALVEIDGVRATEVSPAPTPTQANQICWHVATVYEFFPLPAG